MLVKTVTNATLLPELRVPRAMGQPLCFWDASVAQEKTSQCGKRSIWITEKNKIKWKCPFGICKLRLHTNQSPLKTNGGIQTNGNGDKPKDSEITARYAQQEILSRS